MPVGTACTDVLTKLLNGSIISSLYSVLHFSSTKCCSKGLTAK